MESDLCSKNVFVNTDIFAGGDESGNGGSLSGVTTHAQSYTSLQVHQGYAAVCQGG